MSASIRRRWLRLLPILFLTVTADGSSPGRRLWAEDVPTDPSSSEIRSSGLDDASAPDATQDKPKQRQREGVKLNDRRGRFERRGERYVFLSDTPVGHYLVLENLMLERVANVLADASGGQLRWSVTGVVTEYRGANYLLLDRAVVKASQNDGEPPSPSGSTTKLTAR